MDHQCADTIRFWYWGYFDSTGWHLQGWTPAGPGPNHRFFLYRDTLANWYANVDVTLVGALNVDIVGSSVDVRLSSIINAYVPAYDNWNLGVSINYNPYQPWYGRDWKEIGWSPPMWCRWYGNDAIRFGQDWGSSGCY